ncbi:Golgi apparatus membrane protein [Apiospora arundinis]
MAAEGLPVTAAMWMKEWKRIWDNASEDPELLSELFYEETSRGKKAVSGSNFKVRHALGLRPVWVYDQDSSLEKVRDILLDLNLVTQEDVDAVESFMKASKHSANVSFKDERRGFAKQLEQLVDKAAELARREKNQGFTEVCKESREAVAMFRGGLFREGSNSIPFVDNYDKDGLSILRFLEAIDEEGSQEQAILLGWDMRMTVDAFLGSFRASVGNYIQIITSPPSQSVSRSNMRATKRSLHKPAASSVEDETIVTVFFSGLVNNVQSRMTDCNKRPHVGNLLALTRDLWQTRPTRLSIRFGLEAKECTNDLKYAGFNTDVDGYVTMRGVQEQLNPADKHHLPLMIEVKAAGWSGSVWRQITAEMGGWIYQTAKPHPTLNAKSGITQHRVMFTQHGAQIYMIIGSFGSWYLEYIHRVRSGKTGEVLTSHLEDKIEALEEKKKGLKLDPSSDGLPFTRDELKELKGDMLNITRYGP